MVEMKISNSDNSSYGILGKLYNFSEFLLSFFLSLQSNPSFDTRLGLNPNMCKGKLQRSFIYVPLTLIKMQSYIPQNITQSVSSIYIKLNLLQLGWLFKTP